ncbi:uncharacterized protein F5891DRAFT_309708 [Suillus fuscotomentosus]|uniref:DUF4336 domain-containing protein n=1 Tax=Suillus fuscotomentosus TaxID=1912939 RepID=A0AAD4HL94_9AGAM|nr:uncharacterized protein F5891DRAFT_309708 [Suillus fuscotomentosus]KAG1900311.1 hypothetical protein F5891DRAFT_309708 [Suillus fuscotomentosus]
MSKSDVVIREVAKDVWIFSRPFARFGIIQMGGRSTAIKLRQGGVWVLASTPLTQDTRNKIDELGEVKYIIGADAVHHMFLGEFKRAYPNAKLIGVEDAIKNMSDKDLQFDGLWGRDLPSRNYGFEDEIKHCYFSGFRNKDVAFLHMPSKSLIEADLLLNLPANEQYSKSSSSPRMNIKPDSWIHRAIINNSTVDAKAMRRDATTVANWDFDRIIPCHGDVIETDGNKMWRTLYDAFLN